MENDIQYTAPRNRDRVTFGVILLAIGIIYLLNQVTFFSLPFWLFSWPMWLIVIGFASGVRHNFHRRGAFVMMGIGGIFLANMAFGFTHLFFWPLMMIGAGVYMLFFKGGKWDHHRWEHHEQWRHRTYGDQNDSI